jgi:cyclophilin family peptidyl-prolyl cis-trans isomerase
MRRLIFAVMLVLALTACASSATTSDALPDVGEAIATTTISAAPQSAEARTDTFQFSAPPEMAIDTSAAYRATVATNYGDIVLDLFASEAPVTVNNFVFLARQDYYDGVIFHRVVPGFVIQGGDPTGSGSGGPGYSFADELDGDGAYTRGILAMANAGKDTNGSQFFIMLDNADLSYAYNIFGEVREGMDVVDIIAGVSLNGSVPLDPVVIIDVIIEGP